jgi:CheY-like chemotaxis protein
VLDACLGMVSNELRHRAQVVRDYKPIPKVFGTHAWLSQVFVQLLLNAAHAIREGNVGGNQVIVATSTTAQNEVLVEVTDTGEGIPLEVRDRVFDPFFTTKPVGGGSGLGLSIVHGIVTALGGRLQLDSAQGRGTTVRVWLPAAPQPVVQQPAPVAAAPRKRLLVIEDEPTLARAFQRMLRSMHDVTLANSGREALEALRTTNGFDAILCDLLMPEMTGMDLHQEIAKSFPGLERRMIFMTGGAFTQRAREFLSQVANPYLSKPFDLQKVSDALAQLG